MANVSDSTKKPKKKLRLYVKIFVVIIVGIIFGLIATNIASPNQEEIAYANQQKSLLNQAIEKRDSLIIEVEKLNAQMEIATPSVGDFVVLDGLNSLIEEKDAEILRLQKEVHLLDLKGKSFFHRVDQTLRDFF